MTSISPASNATHASYSSVDWDLTPGDRVGPSHAGSRRKSLLRRLIALAFVLGGGWLSWPIDIEKLSNRAAKLSELVLSTTQKRTVQAPDAALTPVANTTSPEPNEPKPEPVTAATPAPTPPANSVQAATPVEPAPKTPEKAAVTSPPAKIAAIPAVGVPYDDRPSALKPSAPTAPLKRRATAVGLHPDLSHVLLEKLSAADYQNAGIAIEKAFAETESEAAFIWPRQAKKDLAVFHIHFVAGAPTGCRRYVVAIAKGGWSTTALPIDKCGVKRAAASRS